MNAGKVLTRLIQVFLAINILLFIINGVKITTAYVLSKERVANITSLLESRNIFVDVPLPQLFIPKRKGAIIIPENTTETREQLVKALLSPRLEEISIATERNSEYEKTPSRIYSRNGTTITFSGYDIIYRNTNITAKGPAKLPAAKNMSRSFIDKAGLKNVFKNAYVEDASTDEMTELIYYPRFEGIPIFDSYIAFYISESGILEAVMHMAKMESLKSMNTRYTIYPIDIVLFGIEDHLEFKKPLHITNIILGYHSFQEEGLDILQQEIIPAYKISIEGLKEPLFVNAYTNKAIN